MGLFNLFGKKEYENILGVDFPLFNGKKTWSDNRKTAKYQRKNYYYLINPEKKDVYIQKLAECGFFKANDSDVRYDKGSSYVIVEEKNDSLHIAFHVKK